MVELLVYQHLHVSNCNLLGFEIVRCLSSGASTLSGVTVFEFLSFKIGFMFSKDPLHRTAGDWGKLPHQASPGKGRSPDGAIVSGGAGQ